MDPILQTLLSWQFIIFGLSISAAMFVIKTIVEYLMSQYSVISKESKLWNNLIQPILPIILGGVIGCFFKKFPYPDGLTFRWDRVMFGVVAGLLSTFMYRVLKSLLQQKIASVASGVVGVATPAPTPTEADPSTNSAKPAPTGPAADQ